MIFKSFGVQRMPWRPAGSTMECVCVCVCVRVGGGGGGSVLLWLDIIVLSISKGILD